MSRAAARLTLAAILLTTTAVAGAQQPSFMAGTRLRLRNHCQPSSPRAPCRSLIGEVRSTQGDTLLLREDDGHDHSLLLAPTARVDVSGGTRGHALAGLGLGTLAGIGIGLAASESCNSHATEGNYCAFWYIVTVPSGAVAGLLIGALARSERWDAVARPGTALRLEPAVFPTGLALSAQLQF